jgi:RNA polymerase sigma-70 factor (ECF subfamily)
MVTEGDVNPDSRSAETSSSLLRRVKANDPAAWEWTVRLYSPLVYQWCRRKNLQAADAADIGQEVFQAVARKIGDFHLERETDTFRGWLRTITENKCRDFLRRRQKQAAAAGGSSALNQLQQIASEPRDDSDSVTEETETRILYQRALDLIRSDFEDRTWLVFRQVVLGGRSSSEVARELTMSLNAVYLAKARVLRRLREEFAEMIELRLIGRSASKKDSPGTHCPPD